jgi:hypothetical protein
MRIRKSETYRRGGETGGLGRLTTLPLVRRPCAAPELRCNFLELLNRQTLDSESRMDLVEASTLDFPKSLSVHGFAVKRYEHYAVDWCVRSWAVYACSVRVGACRYQYPFVCSESIIDGVGIRSERQSKSSYTSQISPVQDDERRNKVGSCAQILWAI